ncbi:hypothetical protein KSP39_PZI023993 [Platanthera zijinensis]|uniref:Uncharacterized protein n=1 Tax=Platanthera zijinensis TaxID=2320716 RepID=A0AAP0AT85_9ASPA
MDPRRGVGGLERRGFGGWQTVWTAQRGGCRRWEMGRGQLAWGGSSCSTWKERKKLENKNVVALGGKPIKSHRMPLSVAKPMMKNIKRREEKKMEEDKLLGIFSRHKNNHNKAENRRPEDRVLKSTEGYFNKGVLNVKHLLDRRSEKSDDRGMSKISGKRKRGKGKGKGRGKGKSRGKGKR